MRDKALALDLKVKTEKGERINVEVQVNREDDFRKRSLYYWAQMYSGTIKEAEDYVTLKKSIVINIMDFEIIEETDKYHSEYGIMEKEEHFELIDDLEIHYIELPKFNIKKDIEHMEANELWLTFMKNAGKPEMEDKINELVERSGAIKMAKEMLQEISADELMREQYYAREKARLDAKSRLKYAEVMGMKKGMEKGMKKGMKKGMERRGIEIVSRLLERKFGILPEPYKEKLSRAKKEVIDKIAEDIFEIKGIEDLGKYFME